MKLTPEEQRTYDALVEKMYRSPPVERTAVKYPAVFYTNGNIRAEKDDEGKHSPFSVYDGDELVCKCVYKKGALALSRRICLPKGSCRRDGRAAVHRSSRGRR